MPPRRSHKKSRAGCRRCKNRKIKCDEVHPRCGNCSKHGVMCDFESREVLDELASVATPGPVPGDSSVTSTPAPDPTPSLSPMLRRDSSIHVTSPSSVSMVQQPTISTRQVDRFLELRLLHHYITYTYKTLLTNSPNTDDIWKRTVPQLAFEGPGKTYLADAILSVAALHLRTLTPYDKALVQASHAYSASALASYCASLDSAITAENAEALFLTATLITFQATASRIFIKEDNGAESAGQPGRYALPLPWFHAFQGVKTIVATSWQWIRNSHSVKAVIDSQPSFQLDMNPLGPHSFFGHLLTGLQEELDTEEPEQRPATRHGYAHAVCVLNWAHRSSYAPASLGFPATVSKRFVDLVEAKRPRALVILACFFALLKRIHNVWWLDDVGRREVTGIMGMFEPGSPWWRHLEWPIRIALWDGDYIPPGIWGSSCDEEPMGNGLVESMISHIELMARMMNHTQPQPQPSPSTPGLAELGLMAAPLD